METWGQVLGEGVLQAFSRLEHVENSSRMRGSRLMADLANHMEITIQNVSVQLGDNQIFNRY